MQGGLEGRSELQTIQCGVESRAMLGGGDQTIRGRGLVRHGIKQCSALSGQMTGGILRLGRRGRRMVRQALRRPLHRQAIGRPLMPLHTQPKCQAKFRRTIRLHGMMTLVGDVAATFLLILLLMKGIGMNGL